MKSITKIIPVIILSFILSSCSAHDYRETYFIHVVGFETTDNEFSVHAVCEKLDKKDNGYFLVTRKGNSIKEATKKLMNDYRDCYFATAEIYVIPENHEKSLLTKLASEICDSNIYPTKSHIVRAKGSMKSLLDKIKSEKDLKVINRFSEKNKTNAVKFFSYYMSQKSIEPLLLYINENKEIAVYEDKNQEQQHKDDDKK